MILGCIADDFTGATDIAALLARSGAPVSLRVGVPDEPAEEARAFEVIALKIRTAPKALAVHEALAALDWLKAADAARIFWKYCSTFDSTAEGNIGPVAEALMASLGTDQTIYCPAFPESGRAVFMGNLFVGQEPLAESPMKDHPLTPMRDSNLMRLLDPQVAGRVGLVNRLRVASGAGAVRDALRELREDGLAHVIVDAVADEDLATLAEACRAMPLLSGGSALAMHLPALYAKDGLLAQDTLAERADIPPARTVILSGSCSAMTIAQVLHYKSSGAPSYRLDPLALAENGPKPVLDWVQAQDLSQAPIIYATTDPARVRAAQERLGKEDAGRIVEDTLSACAVAARDAGARRFIVAGGETSGAVTGALGVDALAVGAEIAPGVPWTHCKSDRQDIALTLKSGNFGTEDFFSRATRVLEAT